MTFLSPHWLWLFLGLAALIAAYVWSQGRRRHYALQFTNLGLLDQVAPARPAWRRHVAAALFLVVCATLIVGMGRPAMEVEVPRERATIIVAIDVSPSMAATDVTPDRITAAKESAQSFVESLPDRFNVGLVAFSANATVVSSPTQDHQAIVDSIEHLQMAPGTAIGEAVFTSLQSIQSFDDDADEDPPPSAVVLLSDGENTSGRPVPLASEAAHSAQVPISTIAFGSGVAMIEIEGQIIPADIDKEALELLATETEGHFYEAESEAELDSVYDDIGSSLGAETVHEEIGPWVMAFALVAAFATAGASLVWFSRLP
ncbi:VWA domain-containing protein [Spiractinospora alimapuensis]|uniref:VWA domain-containing protein n=1 Tax=Spiractinospora alimapuensis TaxID=2820884 RepID=UPI001F462D6A|nr:VWA domain-containing protein [Spiractinospora alimapuensis]QVQ52918.1 VWA domain-containing protein [Spiractinospora alimapuensis]